jgi:hypothetical protein
MSDDDMKAELERPPQRERGSSTPAFRASEMTENDRNAREACHGRKH